MLRPKNQYKAKSNFFHGSFIKFVLAIIAICSFSLAFNYDYISSILLGKFHPIPDKKCLQQFYKDTPPYLIKESLTKHTYPLCFNGFNVMYSGVAKTPLWVAESLTPQRLSKSAPREDNFHEELRIPFNYRSTISDYRGSGYIRWRVAPNADMSNEEAKSDSFSLANIIPVANLDVLTNLEYVIRGIVIRNKVDLYVVSGPIFSSRKLKTIGKGVIIPNAVFKAIYIPKTGTIGAYYIPNNDSSDVKIVSVCFLEELLNINLFPQLTEEQKRNTYNLPLSSKDLNLNKEIEYSYWDAESQCEISVSDKDIDMLQNRFRFE